MRAPKNHLPPWYVTGLVDGAGVFTYSRTRTQLMLVFAMRMAAVDGGLLEALRLHFGHAGRIYTGRSPASTARPGSTSASPYYKVTRPPELLRIVTHLDAYPLQSAKRAVYQIWREMVLLRAAYHGCRPPHELHVLADRLSSTLTRK